MSKTAFVYILASKRNGTLYTGVTSNLERRMYEHKHHLLDGFTDKYDVTRLVWFTQGEDIREAITLEKKIKNRNRQWNITLIEKTNPNWDDLAASWMDSATALRYAQNDSNVPPSSCAAQLSSCAAQLSSCAAQLSSSEVQLSSCAAQLSSSEVQLSSCAAQLSPSEAQLSSCEVQLSSCEVQLSSCEAQLSSCEVQLSSCAAQLSSCAQSQDPEKTTSEKNNE